MLLYSDTVKSIGRSLYLMQGCYRWPMVITDSIYPQRCSGIVATASVRGVPRTFLIVIRIRICIAVHWSGLEIYFGPVNLNLNGPQTRFFRYFFFVIILKAIRKKITGPSAEFFGSRYANHPHRCTQVYAIYKHPLLSV